MGESLWLSHSRDVRQTDQGRGVCGNLGHTTGRLSHDKKVNRPCGPQSEDSSWRESRDKTPASRKKENLQNIEPGSLGSLSI